MAEQSTPHADNAKTLLVVEGRAFIRQPDGSLLPVANGEALHEGQVLVTGADGKVTLLLPNGQLVELGPDRSVLIDGDLSGLNPTDATEARIADAGQSVDQILAALDQGKDLSTELEATAAGLTAGGQEEGHGFVQLLRIAEELDPVRFNFGAGGTAEREFRQVTGTDGTATTETVADKVTATTGTGSVQEDVKTSDSGQLTATGGATFVADSQNGVYGSLSIDTDGKWTYTLKNGDSAVQALTDADRKTETFTVTLSDGSKTTVTVNVAGKDDVPQIGQATGDKGSGTVKEDTAAQTIASGKLTVVDADANQSEMTPSSKTNAYGTFSIDKDGNWTFTIDNSSPTVQALAEGQKVTQTFALHHRQQQPDGAGAGRRAEGHPDLRRDSQGRHQVDGHHRHPRHQRCTRCRG
ncbi:retention module-containing protein [Chitinilyticum piscinae]|uniref:Retention module-containing protein n=1 Tax=Chitinilyticum piscinae TaxID=2866724 RepID=A0A8J7FID6_9NEIS|nr:retention module-containing protein [Chitinilyticum piscinae]MBE9607947.1 retention module-containing protein [Chitinilyticum piscinae]